MKKIDLIEHAAAMTDATKFDVIMAILGTMQHLEGDEDYNKIFNF